MRRRSTEVVTVAVESAVFALGAVAFARGALEWTRSKRNDRSDAVHVPRRIDPDPVAAVNHSGVAADRAAGVGAPPDLERGLGGPNRRGRRVRLSVILIVVGVLVAAYAGAVVLWRDPVTDLYARWKQAEAEEALAATFATFGDSPAPVSTDARSGAYFDPNAYARAESVAVARSARRMMAGIRLGQPIGRIAIPKLGVHAVFFHGTRWRADLSRGPGHYKETPLPGVGRTAAIAAHRTTFGAWFRNIDDLRAGDGITVALPYATFRYKVFTHKIVDDEDWSIIEDRGFDALVLSACHPLYSAAQRWVVFARLTEVSPRRGKPSAVWAEGEPVAADAT